MGHASHQVCEMHTVRITLCHLCADDSQSQEVEGDRGSAQQGGGIYDEATVATPHRLSQFPPRLRT